MEKTIVYKTAGGVVINVCNEVLALARIVVRGGESVDELRLPKGHIDPGETAAEAAVREVGEESGYWGVLIVADLGELHSSFVLDGVRYERDERYYLMKLTRPNREAPAPVSEDEALFEPRWLPVAKAATLLTYPTEQAFAERARLWLDKNIPG